MSKASLKIAPLTRDVQASKYFEFDPSSADNENSDTRHVEGHSLKNTTAIKNTKALIASPS